jgi:hypothetical protein
MIRVNECDAFGFPLSTLISLGQVFANCFRCSCLVMLKCAIDKGNSRLFISKNFKSYYNDASIFILDAPVSIIKPHASV